VSEPAPTFRRVLVVLGAAPGSARRLEAAARLAARFHAELVGLFVEDQNLLHMAALPFTRVTGHGPLSTAVDRLTVERSLRRAALEARAVLEEAATRAPVRWSFTTVRGLVAPALAAAADASDLLVLERRTLGRELAATVAAVRGAVLCIREERAESRTVFVFWEEGAAGREALVVAARFAAAADRRLAVLVPADGVDPDTVAAVTGVLAGAGVEAQLRPVGRAGGRLREVLRHDPGAVLVVSRTGVPLPGSGGDVRSALHDVGCSVLVLR
jgi:hypothetical protein